jgi:hypothetical protein
VCKRSVVQATGELMQQTIQHHATRFLFVHHICVLNVCGMLIINMYPLHLSIQIPDPTCEVVNCAYCKGKGVIFTKTVTEEKHLEQHLQSPCPVCLGKLKAGRDGCRYYKEQVESVKFEIPRGARLGYRVKYPHRGETAA